MFKIIKFKKLDSTNQKARNHDFFSVIIAEKQIKGKGRFKRSWNSSKGGIYMSIVLPYTSKPQFYTFIACLSVLKACKVGKIKWPNDLIYKNKKYCGILTENLGKDKSIIGIGVNVNNIIPSSLSGKATSLCNILHKKQDVNKLINKILFYFKKHYKLIEEKKYSRIISDWKKNSFLGNEIKVKSIGKSYSGIAFDIDKEGFLIVKDKKGKKIKVREGDVFV